MSQLLTYAEEELERAGIGDPDADYDGALKPAVLEIVRVFSEQGHSGMSAAVVTAMVERLMRYKPLTPLTGDDDEWIDVSDIGGRDGGALWQNRRYSAVFKDADRGCYDIDSVVMVDPTGSGWNGARHAPMITFPYMPPNEPERIEIDRHGRALDGSGRDLKGFCDDDGCGCWEGEQRG